MALLENSTWRCRCGFDGDETPTTYPLALAALREHQSLTGCVQKPGGPGDRIHSVRTEPVSELTMLVDKERLDALHGPPRPFAPLRRRAREGLSWLPGN